MAPSLTNRTPERQSASADQGIFDGSAIADLDRGVWLESLLARGWTVDSLAAYWGLDRGYVWKVMHGEKSLSRDRVLTFPADVTAEYHARKARACGLIVVERVAHEDAVPMILTGLATWLTAQLLPAKSGGQLKVETEQQERRKSA
jgi:hypothetical protein